MATCFKLFPDGEFGYSSGALLKIGLGQRGSPAKVGFYATDRGYVPIDFETDPTPEALEYLGTCGRYEEAPKADEPISQ